MITTLRDLKNKSDWIVFFFSVEDYILDYTIKSFMEIDFFFDRNSKKGKAIKGRRLDIDLEKKLFAIGAYIGETIIKTVDGAEWVIDENDPLAILNASIKLPNGVLLKPVQKIILRFQNDNKDDMYSYGNRIRNKFALEILMKKFVWE